MDAPKISIITPSYNQAKYLEDTILSVLGQNYPNLEYLIIDGGSTDGSVEIIKKYEKHLAYWVSEPDNGMYHAIQKGFDKSTGEIMAWINSDDMYHPKALYTVAEIFGSFPSVNWLQGLTTIYDESGRTVEAYKSRSFTKFDFYNYDYGFIQQESTFWRHSLWAKTGASLDCGLFYAGDFALWLKFFSCEKLFVTNALIGGFRMRSSNQLSLDFRKEYIEEIEKLLATVTLNKKEKHILKYYRRLLVIIRFIQAFKIFRTDWLIAKYRNRYFPHSQRIEFNQFSQQFELID